MIQMVKDNWYLVAVGAALVLVTALLVSRLIQKRKQEKKEYIQRMKDQALNEALKNNLGRRNAFKKPEQAVPLESSDENAGREKGRTGQILMKLTVTGRPETKISVTGARTENYVVNPEEHVLIGSAVGMNDIILNDKGIAQQHCDFFSYKSHVYVRNLNPACPMMLSRKSNHTKVGEKGVRVLTGDELSVGSSRIEITLIDYVGNVILG